MLFLDAVKINWSKLSVDHSWKSLISSKIVISAGHAKQSHKHKQPRLISHHSEARQHATGINYHCEQFKSSQANNAHSPSFHINFPIYALLELHSNFRTYMYIHNALQYRLAVYNKRIYPSDGLPSSSSCSAALVKASDARALHHFWFINESAFARFACV